MLGEMGRVVRGGQGGEVEQTSARRPQGRLQQRRDGRRH